MLLPINAKSIIRPIYIVSLSILRSTSVHACWIASRVLPKQQPLRGCCLFKIGTSCLGMRIFLKF